MFEQFLFDKNAGHLLSEHHINGGLHNNSRKKLIRVAAEFMINIYGNKAKKNEKKMVAAVVAECFPSISTVVA